MPGLGTRAARYPKPLGGERVSQSSSAPARKWGTGTHEQSVLSPICEPLRLLAFPFLLWGTLYGPHTSYMLHDCMKTTVRGSCDKEIWPQMHFIHYKPPSSSTVGTETPESTWESPRDLSRWKALYKCKMLTFYFKWKAVTGIQKMNELAAL